MNLALRGRSIAVTGFLIAGAIGIVSSTQTWLIVDRADAGTAILVPGASAQPLLAPLSLAVLALGAALSIAARPVRVVFGVLAALVALFLGANAVQLQLTLPLDAVAPSVTEATGLAGNGVLQSVVTGISPTPWPVLALLGWVVLLAASAIVLSTGRRWRTGGRRYRTGAVDPDAATRREAGPVDALNSWDELSRGTDPTR